MVAGCPIRPIRGVDGRRRYHHPVGSLLRWLAGIAGLAGVARLLRNSRRRPATAPAVTAPAEPNPAEELRRKLAEARKSGDRPAAESSSTAPSSAVVADDARPPAVLGEGALTDVAPPELTIAEAPPDGVTGQLDPPVEVDHGPGATAADTTTPAVGEKAGGDDSVSGPFAERRALIHARAQQAISAMRSLDL